MHIREVPADLEGFLLLQRKVPADYKGFLLTIWVPAILERFLRSLKGSCSMLIFPKPSRFLLFSDGSCKILPPWRIFWFLLSSCCFDPQSNAKTSATKFLLKSSCWFTMTLSLRHFSSFCFFPVAFISITSGSKVLYILDNSFPLVEVHLITFCCIIVNESIKRDLYTYVYIPSDW